MKRWFLACMAALALLAAPALRAQSIDVLWYTYSPAGSTYRTQMQALADNAHTYAPGSGVRWRLTFFGPSDTPDFAAYDVLVTQSSLTTDEPFADYSGLFANQAAIMASRGNRTLITGLDPDFHIVTVPGPVDDGPRGMLINAVNWAGSGTGLGIVALDDEDAQWIFRPESFLSADVAGWIRPDFGGPIRIAPFAAGFPINAGLTDAGFTWGAHTAYDKAMPGYVAIHEAVDDAALGITMVTASEAAGGTAPVAEYWCEALLPPLDRPLRLPAGSQRVIPLRLVLLDAAGAPVDHTGLVPPPEVRFTSDGTSIAAGTLQFQRGSGIWHALVDSRLLAVPGEYTLEAVAPGDGYEIELCMQTVVRE